MRTTLSIDDDVLAAARALAARQQKTIGEVITSLARQALQPKVVRAATRNGIPLLPARHGVPSVTPEIVNQLRDELP
jgi:hypothetical protein